MTTFFRDADMNASNELNFKDLLRIRLDVLRREHRELDAAVKDMEASGRPDQLSLRRLKKQALSRAPRLRWASIALPVSFIAMANTIWRARA